jgi:prepilin-type N-terminal cleavage/methylation domain-containing protein
MLKKLKTKDQTGFTIIEVLIVLAIAGLILLVVFLAVPALNRNAHNNQYKTEAANLLSAYQEVSNNNGGSILTSSDQAAVLSSANTKSLTTVNIGTTVPTAAPALGVATFVTGKVCPQQLSFAPTSTGATTRSVSLVYSIEASGGGKTPQCIDTK